jgi:hypothetical protein
MASEPVTVRCPLCHARLVITERGWRCARWAPNLGRCRFSVYRHMNHRGLTPADVRLLCTAGVLPWPHNDGRPGWYVLDPAAPNGCRFTEEEPVGPRAVAMERPPPWA